MSDRMMMTLTIIPRYAPDGTVIGAARRILYDNLSVTIGIVDAATYAAVMDMVSVCADDHAVGTRGAYRRGGTRGGGMNAIDVSTHDARSVAGRGK